MDFDNQTGKKLFPEFYICWLANWISKEFLKIKWKAMKVSHFQNKYAQEIRNKHQFFIISVETSYERKP